MDTLIDWCCLVTSFLFYEQCVVSGALDNKLIFYNISNVTPNTT